MNYKDCPNFGKKDCCGTIFQAFVDHVTGFQVTLEKRNGETIILHPWEVHQEHEYSDTWTALRLTSAEYENIEVGSLTQKSRVDYAKYHHSGVVNSSKSRTCPFFEIS